MEKLKSDSCPNAFQIEDVEQLTAELYLVYVDTRSNRNSNPHDALRFVLVLVWM